MDTRRDSFAQLSKQHTTGTAVLRTHMRYLDAPRGQAEFMEVTPLWKAIFKGDISRAEQLLQQDIGLVNQRGSAGETPLLYCYLVNTTASREIAEFILARVPRAITDVYDCVDYAGENCLHLAIARGDLQLVEHMVKKDKSLILGRANGAFFNKGGFAYMGELPLSFAACLNRGAIVHHLVLSGAMISDADRYGNTAAHMCAYHGLKDMYDLLSDLWVKGLGRPQSLETTHLRNLANNDGLTPIVLAAAQNKNEMFEHLWDRQRSLCWAWDYVSAYNYPLDYIDTVGKYRLTDAGGKGVAPIPTIYAADSHHHHGQVHDPPCTLEVIISGNCENILSVEKILEILDRKWDTYARTLFTFRLILAAVFLVSFLLMSILRSELPESRKLFECSEDQSRSECDGVRAVEGIVLVGACIRAMLDIMRVVRLGCSKYVIKAVGATLMEHAISFITWLPAILGFILDAIGGREWSKVPFSIASIFGWAHLLWFLLAFRLTGPFVIILYHMLLHDVVRFTSLLFIIIMGFAQSLVFLSVADGENNGYSFGQILRGLLEQLLQPQLNDPADDRFMLFPTLAYCFLAPILLLNLLIAMFNGTFASIMEESEKRWQLERARMILDLEGDLLVSLQVSDRLKYWAIVDGRPHWVSQCVNLDMIHSDDRIRDVVDVRGRVDPTIQLNPMGHPPLSAAHSVDSYVFAKTAGTSPMADACGVALDKSRSSDSDEEDIHAFPSPRKELPPVVATRLASVDTLDYASAVVPSPSAATSTTRLMAGDAGTPVGSEQVGLELESTES